MKEKESYEIGSDKNNDQPNIWLPESTLPGFRTFTTTFYWTCWRTAQDILRALALGLSLPDEDYLLRFHDGHNNQLRLLHYPPVPAAELESQLSARMPAHTDWGSITMLFQDDCGGLEVESRQGEFVEAKPLKGAIVMNIGDLLMRWSNGCYTVFFFFLSLLVFCLEWDVKLMIETKRYPQIKSPPCNPSAPSGSFHR